MARSPAGGLRDLIVSSSAHAASGDVWGGSWDNNRAQRNPSTVLKRNYAIKQQMSLFWMEPALGDAVVSSVRSVSRQDSSHQKACLLKISHMTAGGAKAAVPPCDTPAAARCRAVRKRPCLVVSPARVMLCVIRPLSLSLPRSEPQPRSMLCVKRKTVLSRFEDCNLSAPSRTSLHLRGCQ